MVSPKFYEDTHGNILMEICKHLPLLWAVMIVGLPPSLASCCQGREFSWQPAAGKGMD